MSVSRKLKWTIKIKANTKRLFYHTLHHSRIRVKRREIKIALTSFTCTMIMSDNMSPKSFTREIKWFVLHYRYTSKMYVGCYRKYFYRKAPSIHLSSRTPLRVPKWFFFVISGLLIIAFIKDIILSKKLL